MKATTTPPPAIGSDEWDEELRATFGVTLQETLRLLSRGRNPKQRDDPHAADFSWGVAHAPIDNDSHDALRAAAWVLFHQEAPAYGAQLYLRSC